MITRLFHCTSISQVEVFLLMKSVQNFTFSSSSAVSANENSVLDFQINLFGKRMKLKKTGTNLRRESGEVKIHKDKFS